MPGPPPGPPPGPQPGSAPQLDWETMQGSRPSSRLSAVPSETSGSQGAFPVRQLGRWPSGLQPSLRAVRPDAGTPARWPPAGRQRQRCAAAGMIAEHASASRPDVTTRCQGGFLPRFRECSPSSWLCREWQGTVHIQWSPICGGHNKCSVIRPAVYTHLVFASRFDPRCRDRSLSAMGDHDFYAPVGLTTFWRGVTRYRHRSCHPAELHPVA